MLEVFGMKCPLTPETLSVLYTNNTYTTKTQIDSNNTSATHTLRINLQLNPSGRHVIIEQLVIMSFATAGQACDSTITPTSNCSLSSRASTREGYKKRLSTDAKDILTRWMLDNQGKQWTQTRSHAFEILTLCLPSLPR